ncbi:MULTISPECIES: bifunctional aconitate hydratase 2/2-methylisocitrate dehydratase [unclassified Vibrio]|uniref:bifunctional aconitate hydratase 2/2-methylisocitrate dehydratase n=1 Tax=unclassified Vibrio TaxID=2614977 RepID=UPI000B8EC31D|nr:MULTISPECIES: bifunctional aconitate hydratase 2/2-methylisocitrate dehydratase [unclassified Vibrio]NAW91506.1 bifunctional aconitate hydratase 2/2-methylisocitrate dehydratase [Vibrio sp. V24_P1S3T111]OXX22462.1 bifunctional aconitate hydratase 2/2-methylisocitrate dehydratase [Vibrio sp. V05_P4A8T149]OXX27699.1 bifunctional aconitate hydratase 2/2-methylisocitrate dehydratase [Vibrio sp. V06_P1A73T115]OXX31589.1 bifunctional aconitate hydratase 2/2-methylisocitrate dehydratase [Vibrio sp.
MLEAYRKHVAERAAEGVVPRPLNAEQVAGLVELLKNPPQGEEAFMLDLLENRIPPGVDEAAYVKAGFLTAITKGEVSSPLVSRAKAAQLLGTMQGGYNIEPLVSLLDDAELAPIAADALSRTLLMFDAFYDVEEKAKAGNAHAQKVLQSWADAEWFLSKPALQEKITLTVFKVTGETNTDDLSPAPDAWSRPDIPVHALAMLKNEREGIQPDKAGSIGPITQIEALKEKGHQLVYVGDVVGTGSSRKSATNSVLWFMGDDIPFVPNKRAGGYVLGGKIAPIFFNTMEDAGALPIEVDVTKLNMGDVIDVYPFEGKVCNHDTGEVLATFKLKTDVLIDEVRAGGRIPLIVGRGLTDKAREALGLEASTVFRRPVAVADTGKGYTLAQKMVGKACGVTGVRPGTYCEPKMTTVGSQDTTGPMTRDELKDLACLGFSADLVMQSFCHTSAYPKPVDVNTHHTLPDFIMNRGGVSLRPGDGVIHSWLNRMLLPDTVGTGGDSHTRFPLGISFPAGSGLVAFAAATGVMPLDMPESVLVRFKGEMQPGITLRDLVHAIPYYGIKQGLLTVAKAGKINEFSGRVLEIEGVEHLTVEQAFELSDASAERSAAGCTVKLSQASIEEYLNSNITMLKWMIAEGYGDRRTIERRITAMEAWLANPELMQADSDAEYAHVIEIDLAEIKEPILCAPNDPDDARLLSDVQGTPIDEVFIGSCMTNIGHFRAAGKLLEKFNGQLDTRLWVAPPTKMDKDQLIEEGYYGIFGRAGVRIETPGCSLCMGNQARVADKATVMSTSTRNFPNRLGTGANVYLASAELSAVGAILGRIPTLEEYLEYAKQINATAADTYRYLNFHRMTQYTKKADSVIVQQTV